jgi:Amiloride-sensitive sodium channel
MSQQSQPSSDFFDISSIHGLKYIGSSAVSQLDRIFWVFSTLLAFLLSVFLVYQTSTKFMSEKVVIKLAQRQYSISEIPFPSISICPETFIGDNFSSYLIMSDEHLSSLTTDEYFSLIKNLTEQSGFFFFSFRIKLFQLVELLYDVDILASNNISLQPDLSLLKGRTQTKWFQKNVEGVWQLRFEVPFSLVLTKYGYCFTFNMNSASSMFNLDK